MKRRLVLCSALATSLLTALLGAIAGVLGALAISRSALPYNSDGRYFDEAQSVVHHDQSMIAFAVFALLFLIATLVMGLLAIMTWRKWNHLRG